MLSPNTVNPVSPLGKLTSQIPWYSDIMIVNGLLFLEPGEVLHSTSALVFQGCCKGRPSGGLKTDMYSLPILETRHPRWDQTNPRYLQGHTSSISSGEGFLPLPASGGSW